MKTKNASAAAVVAVVALVLAGCGSVDEAAVGRGDDHVAGEAFSHIHGLGVVEDVLYVATHNGLFAASGDGEATMASEDDHDFMGFTVADTGGFLASGHPNSREDLPANLGMLESTDSGATWGTLSLSGEVDFHALDAKGDTVYGYSSGSSELLVSTDRVNWDSLGRIPLADVTISPDDAATLLITTEQGPQLSADGGRTFAVVDGAPVLMLVDWPRTDQLYGVTPDGVVHHSADSGASWEERSGLGQRPQAMTVAPDGAVYAALQGSIVVSRDGGETFTPYYTWD